ncbi:MAG: DUF547 domain-containing protein [Candidatus Dadabacteria bacterium]|nr:MAG: DUF547 domain-containing protein [Candidatus Dadabacteria bacterium]TDI99516.1 MAG: DUF547 domain-containing protein [Candidatus Dadabacteria bacterium]
MKQNTSKIGLIVILALFLVSLLIQPAQNSFTIISYGLEEVKTDSFDHSYATYNSLLKRYVINARVNYEGFINSRAEFETFLRALGSVDENVFESWTEEQRLAFWINAYNAFTIKAIIDHYPIKRSFTLVGIFYAPSDSILQIKGVWTKLQFRALGNMVTLEEIEHETLRKKFNEPRIHMAINCASISCPDLRNEAYTPEKLEEQLADASTNFVNNPDKGVYVNEQSGKVKLSKIFKWFGDDFINNYGSKKLFNNYSLKENAVLNFTSEYIESEEVKEYLMNNKLKIGYLGYDWHLNEQTDTMSPSS